MTIEQNTDALNLNTDHTIHLKWNVKAEKWWAEFDNRSGRPLLVEGNKPIETLFLLLAEIGGKPLLAELLNCIATKTTEPD